MLLSLPTCNGEASGCCPLLTSPFTHVQHLQTWASQACPLLAAAAQQQCNGKTKSAVLLLAQPDGNAAVRMPLCASCHLVALLDATVNHPPAPCNCGTRCIGSARKKDVSTIKIGWGRGQARRGSRQLCGTSASVWLSWHLPVVAPDVCSSTKRASVHPDKRKGVQFSPELCGARAAMHGSGMQGTQRGPAATRGTCDLAPPSLVQVLL